MAETKQIVVAWKRGAVVMDGDKPKRDPKTNAVVRGPDVPAKTVDIRKLAAAEAMAADDFALAISPTGRPSGENRIRAFAVCAVCRIDDESILMPADFDEFKALLDRFSVDELQLLAVGHLAWTSKAEADDDPLPSSGANP